MLFYTAVLKFSLFKFYCSLIFFFTLTMLFLLILHFSNMQHQFILLSFFFICIKVERVSVRLCFKKKSLLNKYALIFITQKSPLTVITGFNNQSLFRTEISEIIDLNISNFFTYKNHLIVYKIQSVLEKKAKHEENMIF